MRHNCYIIDQETSNNKRGSRRVLLTLVVTMCICLFEFFGGIISGSNALIADAAHMLADSASLFICYFAALIAGRRADASKTYGYFRIEILSSLINGTLLVILAVFVIYSAIRRFFIPFEIEGKIMFIVSTIGLVANLAGILLLRQETRNLNIKGAFLHIIGDTLSSLAVIAGSLIIIYTGFRIIDSLLSIIIGLIILYNATNLIKEATGILMESVPSGFALDEIREDIKESVEGIKEIHDVHIWSISSGIYIFTAHIVVDSVNISASDRIIKRVSDLLREKYNILHTTIQIESEGYSGCR